jgi:AcrR family transcriptional regulator
LYQLVHSPGVGQDEERERLLAAAKAVVLERGVGVSNRELAAAIGTSHRMLDYYFGGRRQLVAAVLDSLSADLVALFDASAPAPGTEPSLVVLAEVEGPTALGPLWLDVLQRAVRGEEEFVATTRRIGAAWHNWLTASWGLDGVTADAVVAAYEGSGVVAVTRGEQEGRAALRRLLAALETGGAGDG